MLSAEGQPFEWQPVDLTQVMRAVVAGSLAWVKSSRLWRMTSTIVAHSHGDTWASALAALVNDKSFRDWQRA
jgi:hypothetical protein